MIDFIKNNIELIVLGAACLVDIILFLMTILKKKVNPSVDKVIAELPGFISFAEDAIKPGQGEQKKTLVLKKAWCLYKQLTGISLSVDSSIMKLFSRKIEEILETPQKKER